MGWAETGAVEFGVLRVLTLLQLKGKECKTVASTIL